MMCLMQSTFYCLEYFYCIWFRCQLFIVFFFMPIASQVKSSMKNGFKLFLHPEKNQTCQHWHDMNFRPLMGTSSPNSILFYNTKLFVYLKKPKYLPQYLSWAEIFHFRYFSPKYLVDVVEVPNGWSTSTCPFWMPMTTKWICFRYLDLSTSHYCKNNKNRLLSSWNKKFCYCLMRFLSAFGGKPARYKYNLLQGERRAL